MFGHQGAVAGWGAGLVLAFWIGIGSIVTHTSSGSPLPSGCKPILSDNATAATIQAVVTSVTKRYGLRLHASAAVTSHIALLVFAP